MPSISSDSSDEESRSESSNTDDEDSDSYVSQGNPDINLSPVLSPAFQPGSSFLVEDSQSVTVGNTIHYNGPVNLHQVVHITKRSNIPTQQQTLLSIAPSSPDRFTHTQQPILHSTVPSSPIPHDVTATGRAEGKEELLYDPPTVLLKRRRTLGVPKWLCCGLLVLLILALVGVVISVAIQFGFSSDVSSNVMPTASTAMVSSTPAPTQAPATDEELTLPSGKRIISRRQWGSKGTRGFSPLAHPTEYVLISHTSTTQCSSLGNCAAMMRGFQQTHLRSKKAIQDIGYNFLVSSEGSVFEGRGWDAKSFHKYDNRTLGVSFIGNFVKVKPSEEQIEAARELLELGVTLGKLSSDYRVIAHNQTYTTDSPGAQLYRIIKTWPHWNGDLLPL